MKSARKIPLPQALKKHMDNITLSDTQLEQLLPERASHQKETTPARAWWRSQAMMPYRLVASIVLVLSVVMVLPFITRAGIPHQVVKEVAYNHNKQMAMEIHSDSMTEIGDYLSQLDFVPIESAQLPSTQWQLLGGRYCSINGKLAVQLKIQNQKDKQIYTFYQAILPDKLRSAKPVTEYADGVKVELWREKGLLMGLAKSPRP